MRKYPTLPVVESVIREAGAPLRVREIVLRSGDRLPTKAIHPDTVVARDLAMDVKHNSESRFHRLEPGLYGIKEMA